MTKRRVGAGVCLAAALVCLVFAGWNAFRIVGPRLIWNKASATVESTHLRYRHDAHGLLVFYIYSRLAYDAGSVRVVSDAESDFRTHEFSEAKALAQQIASSGSLPVYADPANPNRVRFALAYGDLGGLGVSGLACGALAFGIAAAWLRRSWRPALACARCAMPLKHYYRFCPHCRTVLQETPPIPAAGVGNRAGF